MDVIGLATDGVVPGGAVGKRIAIVQSNYIPWKGYFDLIRQVDEFVLYDEVQYTRQDWRNRNRIKTANGPAWLTIPVLGKFGQTIRETRIGETTWARSHCRTLTQAYARAPWMGRYRDALDQMYRAADSPWLSEVNELILRTMCEWIGISTPIMRSEDCVKGTDDRVERLVEICAARGADTYLSGPAAKEYLDETTFAKSGIRVEYADYTGYPAYPQPHPPFEHGVTALDLILSVGPEAVRYMEREVRRAA